jgi:hypothetical protein
MSTITERRTRPNTFTARLAQLLAAIDQTVAWYGAHRAWPANEPARIGTRRR